MTSPQSQDNPSIKQTALENVTGRDITVTTHQNITIHQVVAAQPVAIAATLNTTPPPVDEWQGRQDEIKELQTALSNDNTSDIKKGEQKSYSSDKVQVMNQSTK
jgi:hypothetical protein